MSVLPSFDLFRPTTIEEAFDMLDGQRLPYSGGTELLVAMRLGLASPQALVDLKHIEDLNRVEEDDSSISIGSTVTHRQMIEYLELRPQLSTFGTLLSKVGNPRVRSVGTIGGNLCFAEPRSDVTTFMVAVGARVTLMSAGRSSRSLPVEEFLVGAYATGIRTGEILTRVTVPKDEVTRLAYEKFQNGVRPTAGVALLRTLDGGFRVAVGAVCEVPVARDLGPGDDLRSWAITDEIAFTDDHDGSARYKRNLVSVLTDRVIERLGA